MKKSIIRDIFYGERGRYETVSESAEYWSVLEQVNKLGKELRGGLTEKQKELFERMSCMESEVEAEAALASFTEGFKIGLLIGIECMDG